jgi:magnesium transporter
VTIGGGILSHPESEFHLGGHASELPPKLRAWVRGADGVGSVTPAEAAKLVRRLPRPPRDRLAAAGPEPAADREPAAEPDEEVVEPGASADGVDSRPVVWIDVVNPGDDEAAFLRESLGFHPLAVEDCMRGRQRPKLERYPGYFFLVMYAARSNPERSRVAFNELHIFLGRNFVVTVRDHGMKEVRETIARWRSKPDALPSSGALAHALLDVVVDDYFPIVDHFADRVGNLEAGLSAKRGDHVMTETLALRRELLLFRKVISPERDMLASLLRRDLPFLSPELMPYFQDVRDHIVRVTEEIDTLRDLLATTVDAQMSIASNQLNAVLRMMTAWSIILMSMTLIAGIYGMNFVNMPELEWHNGYYITLLAMLTIGGALFTFFRRRDWI